MNSNVELWMRLGVVLEVPGVQLEPLLRGDGQVLDTILRYGKWRIEGNAYVPECEAEAHGYADDIEFELCSIAKEDLIA